VDMKKLLLGTTEVDTIKSWPELIDGALSKAKKIGLAFLAICVLIWLVIYSFFFDSLNNNANSISDYFWWLGDYWQISLIITLFAARMTWWLISYPFSKLSRTKLHAITIGSLVVSIALTFFNQERTLLGKYIQNDDPGPVKTYISKKRLSHFKMLSGILIDASNVEHAYAVSKGLFPKQIDLYSSDVQLLIVAGEFQFFDSGNPKYFKGTKDQNGIYRLYDRMGFDPISGKLLTKFEEDGIEELKNSIKSLLEKKRNAEALMSQLKQRAAQEAEEKKVRDQQIAEQKLKKWQAEQTERERKERQADAAREKNDRESQARRLSEIENSRRVVILDRETATMSIPRNHEITELGNDCYLISNGSQTKSSAQLFRQNNGQVTAHLSGAFWSQGICRFVMKRFE
jgi:hypothetical protein